MANWCVFWACEDWPADGLVEVDAENKREAISKATAYMQAEAEKGAGPKNWRIERMVIGWYDGTRVRKPEEAHKECPQCKGWMELEIHEDGSSSWQCTVRGCYHEVYNDDVPL